jgi:DNA repair protein RecN (Recombination protein N)
MLKSLHIQNFALIEQATLDFENNFTVFTGETGSGKSILLGALNLILGERADYSVIRNKEEKTVVEGVFKIGNFSLESFFMENDLDFLELTIVRREITAQGKSRSFINDTPVQLTILKELSEKLIHIHSQHHTLELKSPLYQLDILDTLSGNISLKESYKRNFLKVKRVKQTIEQKKAILTNLLNDADYNKFQINELKSLNLDSTSYKNLEEELNLLENVTEIKMGFSQVIQTCSNENGTIDQLNQLKTYLEKNQDLHVTLSELCERLKSVLIELNDIVSESENHFENFEANPLRKTELTEKIDLYNRVLRKHQAVEQEELILLLERLSNQESDSQDLENEIEQLNKQLISLESDLINQSEQLHHQRKEACRIIEKQFQRVLEDLKLENANVRFQLEKLEKLDENGISKLTMLFSPNTGMEAKAIEKTASGGELSRLMLAVQLLMSEKKQLPTVIFDEIDTGVSGEVAQKIGQVLKKMGTKMQIFAITHLPQVAAKGLNHWRVLKKEINNKTQTSFSILNDQDRIDEIARLMSGEKINEAAKENARTLMR